ncbi:hypothetical protein C8F04DRAFT_354962 [Mycena alexandri]|uniref:Uncharacterized protein n=1 Tax=Mycena alexandri TaxID=1745969 RepID=A0AAD6S0I6_9AGAR|nr:hypothetical protein C8F04DRAFT_354962 [Mycena alexandri]
MLSELQRAGTMYSDTYHPVGAGAGHEHSQTFASSREFFDMFLFGSSTFPWRQFCSDANGNLWERAGVNKFVCARSKARKESYQETRTRGRKKQERSRLPNDCTWATTNRSRGSAIRAIQIEVQLIPGSRPTPCPRSWAPLAQPRARAPPRGSLQLHAGAERTFTRRIRWPRVASLELRRHQIALRRQHKRDDQHIRDGAHVDRLPAQRAAEGAGASAEGGAG